MTDDNTRRNLMTEFNRIANTINPNILGGSMRLPRRAPGHLFNIDNIIDSITNPQPATEINLSFTNQATVTETTGPVQINVPTNTLNSEDEECAEALRTVMAIIFEKKDDLGDGDYLEMTNLLKKVYDTKDPVNLREELKTMEKYADDLYEEMCEKSRENRAENRYYIKLNAQLHAEQVNFKKAAEFNLACQKTWIDMNSDLKEDIVDLKEDIVDLKKDNDVLWDTKFYYQNKLLKLAEKHPEILSKEDLAEVNTIKKRKAKLDSHDVLDTPWVKVRLSREGKRVKVSLDKETDYTPELSILEA